MVQKESDTTDSNDDEKFCVIHVGPHKTGSTTLQWFLAKHKDDLAKDGYATIVTLGGKAAKAHSPLANCAKLSYTRRCPTENSRKKVFNAFHSFVDDAAARGSIFILSSEDFDRRNIIFTKLTSVL